MHRKFRSVAEFFAFVPMGAGCDHTGECAGKGNHMAAMQEMTETAFGRELVIDRKTIKPFAKRSDREGLIHFAGHMGLLALNGRWPAPRRCARRQTRT